MSILSVLKDEKELMLQMLDALKREKEILIKDDVKELEGIVKLKEELKYRIDDIEKVRMEMCGDKKLKDIILEFEGSEKKEAESLGKDIEEILSGIQEANSTNNLLIKQSLNYIRSIINIIAPSKPSVYKPTGMMETGSKGSSLLNKSV